MQRQVLLILYSASSHLTSEVVAWSLYDGTGQRDFEASGDEAPPYPSVLAAMRDGWRVIQLTNLFAADPGPEQSPSYLRFETVLERIEG